MERFTGNFTQQESISDDAIEAAVEVMRHGRLHRYNTAEGEISETVLLENEFSAYMGSRYCLACSSGGYALHIALRAAGLKQGEPVLTNGFTLAPVPGAIHNAGGRPVLVEITDGLVMDLDDLEKKITSSGARLLMLSHMRGHLVDMERVVEILERHDVQMIEDCAHTMGASWNGRKSGTFGLAACFSTQTYKHMNSGEGGFLTSDNDEFMARAIVHSGSYMLYEKHQARPPAEVFERVRLETPNYSGRMDNLRAAILRRQLNQLDENCARWNERYHAVENALAQENGLQVPARPEKEVFVGSSIQFLADGIGVEKAQDFVKACLDRGVEVKWFGADEPVGYTSRHDSWHYMDKQSLPESDAILVRLYDMRIPLTFSVEDCTLIGKLIVDAYRSVSLDYSVLPKS